MAKKDKPRRKLPPGHNSCGCKSDVCCPHQDDRADLCKTCRRIPEWCDCPKKVVPKLARGAREPDTKKGGRRPGRQEMRDWLGELEGALSLSADGTGEMAQACRSALSDVRRAADRLKDASLDRVYASAPAERHGPNPGSLVVGVNAHCACGRVFRDDVLCHLDELCGAVVTPM